MKRPLNPRKWGGGLPRSRTWDRLNERIMMKLVPEHVIAAQRVVLERYADRYGREGWRTARTLAGLSTRLWAVGELDEAAKMKQEALDLYRKHLGPDHPLTLEVEHGLALLKRQIESNEP
jgi:Tetratricopeptide repeat